MLMKSKLCQGPLPHSGIGQLDHVPDPLGHVRGVALHVPEPGVAHQGGEVGPLGGVLLQADVHKVLHFRREHSGWQP